MFGNAPICRARRWEAFNDDWSWEVLVVFRVGGVGATNDIAVIVITVAAVVVAATVAVTAVIVVGVGAGAINAIAVIVVTIAAVIVVIARGAAPITAIIITAIVGVTVIVALVSSSIIVGGDWCGDQPFGGDFGVHLGLCMDLIGRGITLGGRSHLFVIIQKAQGSTVKLC